MRQNREALELVSGAGLGVPFLLTKDNHDVTGAGAVTAFDPVILPFMQEQARRIDASATGTRANPAVTPGKAHFAFFEAYDKTSLEWLEAAAASRTAHHWFLVVHPPVVPDGAHATWHLYVDEKSAPKRAKLLALLAEQEAMVLGGHLHKLSALTWRVGARQLTQLAVRSVVSSIEAAPRAVLNGSDAYNSGQINLEPRHSAHGGPFTRPVRVHRKL